ncbi:receptor-like kinase, partial [Trifolium medium]|nr:receptor-like kinase [Trifolium medium]
MLVDIWGLWFRVLAARYGVERGSLKEGGRGGSSWWREIVKIRDGIGGLRGGWFGECVSKTNKSSTVAEMSSLGWDDGGDAWEWRRQLWAWEEEMLGKCRALLHN